MLDSLIQSVENAFVQFSFRRLLYILFLLITVAGALYVFNELTGYTLYRRVDNQIDALQRLHALEQSGIKQSPELAPLFQAVVQEMGIQPVRPFDYSLHPEPLLKFFGAALIPFTFVIVGVFQIMRREPDSVAMFSGALAVTLILGLPAVFVPTWRSPWATAGVLLVLQLLVLVWIVRWNSARTRRANSSASQASPVA